MSATIINNINHIYIICHKHKESDKYNKWIEWMKHNNISNDYVSFHCYKWGDELTEKDISDYSYDDGTLIRLFPFRANFPLKKSEISLSINFLQIFKDGLNKNYDNILVFESDAILHPEFITKLNAYMKEVKESYNHWHMLSLGCGMNRHHSNIKKNKHIYNVKDIRCLDSFVITKSGMKTITNLVKKVNLPIDEKLGLLIKNNKIIMLWAEPTIVVQGSQTGINPTTIRYSDSVYVTEKDCDWLGNVMFK